MALLMLTLQLRWALCLHIRLRVPYMIHMVDGALRGTPGGLLGMSFMPSTAS